MTATEDFRDDIVTPAPLARLAATLDHISPPWRNGEVPPLGHWLFNLPDARQSALGPDGHPHRGADLAGVRQPRRMWAGSRLTFPGTLRIGDAITRRSRATTIADKGAMTFVTMRHEVSTGDAIAVTEEQDLVYLPMRDRAEPGAPKAVAVPTADTVRTLTADAPMLLRFSALTFNAHRIHYDRDYACDVEQYPGLIVHGPLLATLLMDHALRAMPGARVATFAFRARSPVIAGEPFDLCRTGDDLWVRTHDGIVAMTAQIGFA